MKTRYGFTRFDSINEFSSWLNKQKKYNYTGLQLHHTWSPEYKHFYKSDGSHEDELTRQYNTKTYHVNHNGWSNIAQHFTIFPNGRIVTGRPLSNTTAIGIKGWNSNKICIEVYGNFDKGHDVMNDVQKKSVIAVYALLCKKFGITPSTSTIRCHCWFTAGGTYLGDYNSSRSAKTCPGTNFMGIGNRKSAIANKFIPLVKEYMANGSVSTPSEPVIKPTTPSTPTEGKYIVRYLQQVLNYDYDCGLAVDSLYGPKTQSAVKKHPLKKGSVGHHVEWLQKALNNRVKAGLAVDGSFGPATYAALKLYQGKKGLDADGMAGPATHQSIIND